jgi:catechol 2,3-dioxygenase-like lactoylglutathione lyase family enzyme
VRVIAAHCDLRPAMLSVGVAVRRGTAVLACEESAVPGQIPTGDIHHLRLTVTDVERSRQFYTGLLGFQVAVESPPDDDPSSAEVFKVLFGGVVMVRGNLLMGLRPMAPSGDRFDPDRVGLDHLSFGVASHDDLDQAARLLDEAGVRHGDITSLPSFGIDVLPFEDPDGVQLELTAPMAGS